MVRATTQTVARRRDRFRALHDRGCFVLPNPWDRGTAIALHHLGFQALATTSAGFAFSNGEPDSASRVPLNRMLRHIAVIVRATDLPVNADFENAYADEPDDVARHVRACIATGVAGLSVEDNTTLGAAPGLYPYDLAVARVEAAVRTAAGSGVVVTARCEAHLVGHPDADREVARRLVAFAEVGADVLYAPGLRTADAMRRVIALVAPKPVNILVSGDFGLSVADVAALGARRISVGSAFARAAWGGFLAIAREVAGKGSFTALGTAEPFPVLNGMFTKPVART